MTFAMSGRSLHSIKTIGLVHALPFSSTFSLMRSDEVEEEEKEEDYKHTLRIIHDVYTFVYSTGLLPGCYRTPFGRIDCFGYRHERFPRLA
jgi:hypothetical protein